MTEVAEDFLEEAWEIEAGDAVVAPCVVVVIEARIVLSHINS